MTVDRSGHAGTSGNPQCGHRVVISEPGRTSRAMPTPSATVMPSADRVRDSELTNPW
jgi:hypothetical protein